MTKNERLYLKAKEAYYLGSPIMEDIAFDKLEDELRELGSNVINLVGQRVEGIRDKFTHISPMLSLRKISTDDDEIPSTEEFMKWVKSLTFKPKYFETSPKFDGNAINLIYVNNELQHALTRGDGEAGQIVTDKLEFMVPKNLKNLGNWVEDEQNSILEIRGEVMIRKSVFEKHYGADFKNPRNFVAGIMNHKTLDSVALERLDFVPYDVRVFDNDGKIKKYIVQVGEFATDVGFKKTADTAKVEYYDKYLAVDFESDYKSFLTYRENAEYQLDGIVWKAFENEARLAMGETSHHPRWSIAIKFQSKATITKIRDITWQIGTGGIFTPVAELEPVELDGSVVSRCTLHNYGNVKNNHFLPGAWVEIAKMGDIIPGIVRLVKESDIYF